jgi:hypothetical protein
VIYLAPDPDRGGSYRLACCQQLQPTKAIIKRATFNEINNLPCSTLEHAGELELKRYKLSILARARLGRRLPSAPFLWKTVCRGLSAGRAISCCVWCVNASNRPICPIGILATPGEDKSRSQLTGQIDGKNKLAVAATEEIVEVLAPDSDKAIAFFSRQYQPV